MTDTHPSPADERPETAANLRTPPRFWWLKRLAIAAVAFLFLVAGVRVLAGWRVQARLRGLADQRRAEGRPTASEDFAGPALDDAHNRVAIMDEAALRADVSMIKIMTADALKDGLPLDEKATAEIEDMLSASADALRLAREARHHAASWPVSTRPEAWRSIASPAHRQLSLTLSVSALYCARTREAPAVQESLEQIRDMFAQAEMFLHHRYGVTYVLGNAYRYQACDTIVCIVRALSVNEMGPALEIFRDAGVRTSLDALACELQSTLQHDYYPRMLKGEAVDILEMYEPAMAARLDADAGPVPTREWLAHDALRPLRVAAAIEEIRHLDLVREALASDSYARSMALLGPGQPHLLPKLSSLLIEDIRLHTRGHWDDLAGMHFEYLATARCVSALLAAVQFCADQGRWPDSLDVLVPAYLPEVPVDPFSPTGTPLQYRLTGTELLIYSVGRNGHDNQGVREHGTNRDDLAIRIRR